jgi:hypothetical protein
LFLSPGPTRLTGVPFSFGFWHAFSVYWNGYVSRWRARVEEYRYQITDATGHELFAFHWDPMGTMTIPHMHLGFGMRGHQLPIDNKAHIPTGRVPIADIVSFLISELHVPPLFPDWEKRLAVARQSIADAED